MKIATIGERGSLLQDKLGRLKACVSVNGKQYQKRVKNEEEARQFVLSVELERDNRDELTAKQLNDASNALHLLRKAKVDVKFVDAIRFYLDNAFEGVVSVEEAVGEFLEWAKTRLADSTIEQYTRYLNHFAKRFGERKVASITKKDMTEWLSQYEDKRGAWLNSHVALCKFFSQCVKYDYCKTNPCHSIEPPLQTHQPKREFLTVEDAQRLMDKLVEKKPKLIVYVVLGLFGGLRPCEAFRLTEKHVNMETRYISISGDITKSHSFKERMVYINDTLYAWLKKYPFKKVSGKNARTPEGTLRNNCLLWGIPKTKDVFRHTFGTYQFALTGNSAETAQMMGHAESVGLKYYRGRVTREAAQKFFAIRPKEETATDLDDL